MKKLILIILFLFPLTCFADSQQIFIQLRFCNDTPQGTFCDSLYFTQAEFAASTPAQRNALMNQRTLAWRQIILNPPPERVLSKEELEVAMSEIDEARAEMLVRRQKFQELWANRSGGGTR